MSWKSFQVVCTPSFLKASEHPFVCLTLSLLNSAVLIWQCLGTFLGVTTWGDGCDFEFAYSLKFCCDPKISTQGNFTVILVLSQSSKNCESTDMYVPG